MIIEYSNYAANVLISEMLSRGWPIWMARICGEMLDSEIDEIRREYFAATKPRWLVNGN
jgi:hypothetical protein